MYFFISNFLDFLFNTVDVFFESLRYRLIMKRLINISQLRELHDFPFTQLDLIQQAGFLVQVHFLKPWFAFQLLFLFLLFLKNDPFQHGVLLEKICELLLIRLYLIRFQLLE